MGIYSKNIIRISFVLVIAFALNHLLFSQSSVNTISQLRALSPGASSQVTVLGYYESGDWGNQRTYNWVGTSTAADNGGTIIRPDAGGTGRWIMVVTEDYYNVKWFGARGQDDPAHNDHAGILNCIDAVAASSAVSKVFFPIGIYQLTQSISLSNRHSGITFEGENLAFKMEEIEQQWPHKDIRDPVEISWSPVTEFRVVDEMNSSVLKRAGASNRNYLLRFFTDENIDNVLIKNLAFNGNRWEGEKIRSGNLLILHGNGNNNKLENVALYKARSSGLISYSPVTIETALIYSNNWHGLGSHGDAIARDIEAHHNGFDEQLIRLDDPENPKSYYGGAQGVDWSSNGNILEDFWVHHNFEGVKSSVSATSTTWKNGILEYNYNMGIQHTQEIQDSRTNNVFINNVISRYNGGGGMRNTMAEVIKIENFESYGNGIRHDLFLGITAGFILANNITIRDHNGVQGDYASYFEQTNIVKNIKILDNDKTGLYVYHGTTTIESGRVYNNSGGGIRINNGRTLIIGNVDFNNNGEYDIFNEGTVKYTALSGNPVFTGGGTFIKLPESGITSTVVTGTSVTLTYQASTEQPGRSISSVRLYKYVPGSENPLNNIEDILIDTKSGSGPHETTVEGLQEGERYRFYTIARDNQGDEGIKPLDFEGHIEGKIVEIQNISLQFGWNIISSHTKPGNTNLPDLFSEIKDNLQLVKNGEGDVYDPSNGNNDIGPWKYSEAYRVFLNNPVLFIIGGTPIDPGSSPINLKKGRNFTAYYLSEPMNIEAALASIGNKLELVTDINGNIYWPTRGINSIGAMKPGEGYIIHVNEDVTLVYPSNSN